MGLTAIIPIGVNTVMADERIIALCHVLTLVGDQVESGGRAVVGAVVLRRTAERPECLLHVLGQGREAFPALNHTDVFPAAVADQLIRPIYDSSRKAA